MIKCPLISYQKQYCGEVECMGKNCMLWNQDKGSCLIRLALLKYASNVATGKEEETEEKLKKLQQQVQMASIGFQMYSFTPPAQDRGVNGIEKVKEGDF